MPGKRHMVSKIRSILLMQLGDGTQSDIKYLIQCHPSIPRLFKDALEQKGFLLAGEAEICPDIPYILLNMAEQHVNSTPYQLVKRCWLRLYTDATITYSLCQLKGSSLKNEDKRELIRMMDMAIIVAGAIGGGRLEWLLDLIAIAQGSLGSTINLASMPHIEPPLKKLRLGNHDLDQNLTYAAQTVMEVPIDVTIFDYLEVHTHHPIILRGYASHNTPTCLQWKALDLWRDSDYLRDIAGPGRVVPVEIGHAYDEAGWTQKILKFDEFLERSGLGLGDASKAEPPMYLAQYGLFRQFPRLEQDITIPDFAFSAPPAPQSYPNYEPPLDTIINVWAGSGSHEIVSPPHTDPYYNCYVQVTGRKRVWLAPPQTSALMAAYSEDCEQGSTAAQLYMNNTSQVPIFKTSLEQLALSFPTFTAEVLPMSLETVLSPGDMMIMPPGWWHAMTGEGSEPVWSVSMWF